MAISGVNSVVQANYSFKAQNHKNEGYENPINRKTERNLSVLGTVGVSAIVGSIAAGLTTSMTKGWKMPTAIGAAAGLLSLALLLPSKIYNTKVNAFAREKEMDVFSRQKEAQTNIYSDINKEIKNENVSLDDKIKHYSTVAMADNGRGVMVKDA